MNCIEEIARPEKDMVSPSGSPDFVAGLLSLRGELLTIIDLKSYYGFGKVQDLEEARILVVKGVNSKYGFLVDSVDSIETVDESEKTKLPTFFARDVIRADSKNRI